MSKSASQLRHSRSVTKLLDLLSDTRWKTLADELGLPEGTDRNQVRRKSSLIVGKISRTKLFEIVLEEWGPAFSMLAEIISFLELHKASARSTNSVATLPGLDSDLKPQQRELLTTWDKAARRRLGKDPSLGNLWNKASEALDGLLGKCSGPSRGRWRDRWRLGVLSQEELEPQYHEEIVTLLRKMNNIIKDSLPNSPEGDLLKEIAEKSLEIDEACDEHEFGHRSGLNCIEDFHEEEEACNLLAEELRLRAELEEKDALGDLLAIAVFRNLPQLYEVWILCFVLRTLEEARYSIKLEQLECVEGRSVWNLKYAKAKRPVASIGEQAWVYFQFKSSEQPAMPDIAIFDNDSGKGKAMAVFDANTPNCTAMGEALMPIL